ncbi:MAG: bifunctional glutamate N-acetyltransferase/amino-acid acetyltransferase ArgJ [Candidatus Omnitrophota bacterium]
MIVYKRAILPLGFSANAVASGIKKSGKLDLALFYSQTPAKASCKFTSNKLPAAPVKLNKEYLRKNKYFQALLVNSGNANAFTGKMGLVYARKSAQVLGLALKIKENSVLVNSTGIIGKPLPFLKIKQAVPDLVKGLSRQGINKAKKAILTTDTFSKEATVRFKIGKSTVTICAVAKGAGMIAPDMATMLSFILTDANISQKALDLSLNDAVTNSFNCITVDGCMSTNDTVILLANAQAANPLIKKGANLNLFSKALNIACLELAKMIIRDAEGATKFIKITVEDARDSKEARKIALSIANSSLFKTAMFGENPNFGRIVSSVGASGTEVKEEDLKVSLSPLNKKEIDVTVSVGRGKARQVIYTSDLTPEYIKINAAYN